VVATIDQRHELLELWAMLERHPLFRTDEYDDVEQTYAEAARELGLHSANFTRIRNVRNLIAHPDAGVSQERVVRSCSQLRAALVKIHGYEKFHQMWSLQLGNWATEIRAPRSARDEVLRSFQRTFGSAREHGDLEDPIRQSISFDQFRQCRSVRDRCSHPAPPPFADDVRRALDTLRGASERVAGARRVHEETARRLAADAASARLAREAERAAQEAERAAQELARREQLQLEQAKRRQDQENIRRQQAEAEESSRRQSQWEADREEERKRAAAARDARLQEDLAKASARYSSLVHEMFPLFLTRCISRLRLAAVCSALINMCLLVLVFNIMMSSNGDAAWLLSPGLVFAFLGVIAVLWPIFDPDLRSELSPVLSLQSGQRPHGTEIDFARLMADRAKKARQVRSMHNKSHMKTARPSTVPRQEGLVDDVRKAISGYRTWQALSAQRKALRQDWDKFVRENMKQLPDLLVWGSTVVASSCGTLTYLAMWPMGFLSAFAAVWCVGTAAFVTTPFVVSRDVESAIRMQYSAPQPPPRSNRRR